MRCSLLDRRRLRIQANARGSRPRRPRSSRPLAGATRACSATSDVAPPPPAHATNRFLSKWFASWLLGAESGLDPAPMEEEDGGSGGGLSRAAPHHGRPPSALDLDCRRQLPAAPIWAWCCVSTLCLQAAQLLVDGGHAAALPNCSSCSLPQGCQIGQNSPGAGGAKARAQAAWSQAANARFS